MRPDAWHAQEHFARGPQELDRELLRVLQGPRSLRIVIKREIRVRSERALVETEAVFSEQMLVVYIQQSR